MPVLVLPTHPLRITSIARKGGHDVTPTLTWSGGTLALPELEAPYAVQSGADACRDLIAMLYDDDVSHTRSAIAAWIELADGPERLMRRDLVDRASRFLDGTLLRDWEQRYADALASYLDADPAPRAAAIVVAAMRDREPAMRWSEPPTAFVAAWLASRVPSLSLA